MTTRKVEDKFERTWLSKFAYGIEEYLGSLAREEIMKGSKDLPVINSDTDRHDWTVHAIRTLDNHANLIDKKDIMNNCACFYHPESRVEFYRKIYEQTEDIDQTHHQMQQQFIERIVPYLKEMGAPKEFIAQVVEEKWGEAGTKDGKSITVIKMPADLDAYLAANTDREKAHAYCHCPRIREMFLSGQYKELSETYCYCGGGFYTSLWEGIVGKPVDIELKQSLLKGDKVCSFKIHL